MNNMVKVHKWGGHDQPQSNVIFFFNETLQKDGHQSIKAYFQNGGLLIVGKLN